MKPKVRVNDQVKMYPDVDTLYFIADININNFHLVDICKIDNNQIIHDVTLDQLTMDKLYLLRKISAINEIKSVNAISPEIAMQLLEKSTAFLAECETISPLLLMEVNSAVIEWQSLIPTVSDIELNKFLKQNH